MGKPRHREAGSFPKSPDKSMVQRARLGVQPSAAWPLLVSHTPPRPHPVLAVGARPPKVTLPPKMPLGLNQSPSPPPTPQSPWSGSGLGKARSPFIKTHKCPVVFFYSGQRIAMRGTVVKSWTGWESRPGPARPYTAKPSNHGCSHRLKVGREWGWGHR